jgi:tRNA pseudouridine55 synthase
VIASAGGRSGILLIDKPQGLTSHDVVAKTRRAAGTRKVGHAGTLDPMATGLLVLGLNSATRLLTHLVGLDKEYLATIRLGQSTDTDDAEGQIVETRPAEALTNTDIVSAIAHFTGPISQVPSTVSAIKVDGQRAYARARAGEDVILAPRPVTISAFEILSIRHGTFTDLDVRIECSSGTYVRALARDLGQTLGTGGHLTALRRTRVGPFSVENATGLDTLEVETMLVSSADAAATLFHTVVLDRQQATDLGHGKSIEIEADGTVAAVSADGRLIGLATVSNGNARPLVNFPEDGSPA